MKNTHMQKSNELTSSSNLNLQVKGETTPRVKELWLNLTRKGYQNESGLCKHTRTSLACTLLGLMLVLCQTVEAKHIG